MLVAAPSRPLTGGLVDRYNSPVHPCQFLSVVTLASALVGAGVLPPGHLHRSTAAHPQVVHAHWEAVEHPGTQAAFAVDDEHGNAVVFDTAIAVGPASPAPSQLAALSQPGRVERVASWEPLPSEADPGPAPSPPPRAAAPRAPPA